MNPLVLWPQRGIFYQPRVMDERMGPEKTKVLGEKCLSRTLSITDPTWIFMRRNAGLRGENPETNLLSYGTAYLYALAELSRIS
jgi:hypothetical protein